MNLPRYVQGQNEQNYKNELYLKRSCVNSIVLVYTNGWTIQDIMFTD